MPAAKVGQHWPSAHGVLVSHRPSPTIPASGEDPASFQGLLGSATCASFMRGVMGGVVGAHSPNGHSAFVHVALRQT